MKKYEMYEIQVKHTEFESIVVSETEPMINSPNYKASNNTV